MKVVNGISSNVVVEVCVFNVGQRTIIDFKFLDASTLVLLCNGSGMSARTSIHSAVLLAVYELTPTRWNANHHCCASRLKQTRIQPV